MCDAMTEQETDEEIASGRLTRRDFNRCGSAAALSLLFPPLASALQVVEQDVSVPTPDGEADCYYVHPGDGRHPAVIVWPDIAGLRPAFRAMGKRLAESGYAVLVPNLYYRSQPAPVVAPGKGFWDPETREKILPMARSLSPRTCVSDGRAFVDFLDAQAAVDTRRGLGTTGYCMTGSYTLRLAAAMPQRVRAAGSFHGGGLATDAEDSPHLLAPSIEAGVLIAIADNDDERDPDAKHTLRSAFDAAGVDAEIEVYDGAMHGWCALDSRAYDEEKAERAWSRLLTLLDTHL